MFTDKHKIDRFFLMSVIAITTTGFIIFLSASLGLLANDGTNFGTVALKQTISLIIGIVAFIIFSKLNYSWLKKLALLILIDAIIINLLLFIPSLTLHYNGATRWLVFAGFSFQPSELLKIAFIIYLAAWINSVKDKISTIKFGLFPYIMIVGILSILLLTQRDTDTFVIIAGTGIVMLFIAGVRIRHITIALCLMAVFIGSVIFTRPYALDRVKTFVNRGSDSQNSGYQINQSLIAIGSGGILGRGFGQSVQKFGYLPQPTDDSIFAVAAEEFGFLGSIALLALYIMLAISIFRIANRALDTFGGLLVVGIGVLIITESFMNIAAMLGLIPLSGLPLLFVSHGGTALIITLSTMGMVANVSKFKK